MASKSYADVAAIAAGEDANMGAELAINLINAANEVRQICCISTY